MKVKFSDIATFIAGQSPESQFYSETEGTPFLQGNRTFGMFYPTIDTYTKKVTKTAHEGDILMSVRAPVGDLNFAPCDLCIGRGLSAINAKDGDNAFLFYALKYNIRALLNHSNGTTYDAVTGDDIRQMDMILPDDKDIYPLISKLLRQIDEKIENNTVICSDLEAMAKLLYDYWFVQFDFPDENGKPYKSSGGKMVWNEELKREIPVGWEVKPLGDIITESSKSTVQVNGAKADGSYPFFTSGSAILAYDQFFVDGFHCFLNTGGNPDIKGYKGKCAYSTDTWCIDAGKFSYFMYQYFMLIVPQFERLFFAGSGLKHLQKDALKKQCVALPSDEVIGEFNDVLDDLWDKRTACFLENQQLASLRDFLLPMLMNGQVKAG